MLSIQDYSDITSIRASTWWIGMTTLLEKGLRYHTYTGDTTPWHCTCYIGYTYYIHDMSLVLVDSCADIWSTKIGNQIFFPMHFTNFPYIYDFVHWCADIWSTKIGNQIFFSRHFTNFPYIIEAFPLCSLRFTYTNIFIFWLSCYQR